MCVVNSVIELMSYLLLEYLLFAHDPLLFFLPHFVKQVFAVFHQLVCVFQLVGQLSALYHNLFHPVVRGRLETSLAHVTMQLTNLALNRSEVIV